VRQAKNEMKNEMFGGKGWGGKEKEKFGDWQPASPLPLSYPVLYVCQRTLLLP